MNLILRFTFTAALVAGLAVLVTVALGGRLVERSFETIASSHITFLLTSLRSTVEANLGLGLPLGELRGVQAQMDRTTAAEEDVRAIDVLTPQLISALSTDRGVVGAPAPEAWQAAISLQQQQDIWIADDRSELAFGTAVINDFGQPAGYVVIVLDGAALTDRDANFATVVALAWLPMVLAVVLCGALGAGLGYWLERRSRRLAALAIAVPPPKGQRGDCVAAAQAMLARAATASDEVARAEKRLTEIDAAY